MLQQEDLDAAVAEGILTAAQVAALSDLALRRERRRIAELGHEERFRFMRGFNDFFFAVGVVLVGATMLYFSNAIPVGAANGVVVRGSIVGNLITGAAMWGLAELLVRRMRLVLPGILLAVFFVLAVTIAIPTDSFWPAASLHPASNMGDVLLFGAGGGHAIGAKALKGIILALAALVFYVRFRLPFALLLIAGGLVVAIVLAATAAIDASAQPFMLLLCGLGVFAAAMAFDSSDPQRTTRRADCAFWLHLLAAPLIVHSLMRMVTPQIGLLAIATISSEATTSVAAVLAVVIVLTIVAVIIDRRALLVSALTYVGAVIAFAIATTGQASTSIETPLTLFILGVLVLTIGVGWLPLRRLLMIVVPSELARRLPPTVPA
jgi:hypothetical protein